MKIQKFFDKSHEVFFKLIGFSFHVNETMKEKIIDTEAVFGKYPCIDMLHNGRMYSVVIVPHPSETNVISLSIPQQPINNISMAA